MPIEYINYILLLLSGALMFTNLVWAIIYLSGLSLGITKTIQSRISPLRRWTGFLALWLAVFGFGLGHLNIRFADSSIPWLATIAQYYYAYFHMITLPMGAIIIVQLVNPQVISWKRIANNFIPFILLCGIGLVVPAEWQHTYFTALTVVMIGYAMGMTVYICICGKRFEAELKNLYSSTYGRSVKWMGVVVAMLIVAVVNFSAILLDEQSMWAQLVRLPLLTILWNYVFAKIYIMLMIREEPTDLKTAVELAKTLRHEDVESAPLTPQPITTETIDATPTEKVQEEAALDSNATEAEIFRQRLYRVCEQTELYTQVDIKRDDLAAAMKMGRTHFSTMLKETMGMSFYDYINGLRIQKAKELLANPYLDLTAIAKTAGFNYRSTFYRVFDAIQGCSPAEYRDHLPE